MIVANYATASLAVLPIGQDGGLERWSNCCNCPAKVGRTRSNRPVRILTMSSTILRDAS